MLIFCKLTSNKTLDHRHPVGGERASLVGADGSGVTHRLAGVQMPHQVVVEHHFLQTIIHRQWQFNLSLHEKIQKFFNSPICHINNHNYICHPDAPDSCNGKKYRMPVYWFLILHCWLAVSIKKPQNFPWINIKSQSAIRDVPAILVKLWTNVAQTL